MKDLRLELAFTGNLESRMAEVKTQYLEGLKSAVIEEGHAFQEELREEVRNAGLGAGVANAWRLEVSPKGNKLAYEPAVFLFSKAAHIVENFSKGEPYGPRKGAALAVPIPGSPAEDLRVRKGGSRVEAAKAKFGELKVIITKRGLAMLVAFGRDNGKGGFRRLVNRKHKDGGTFTPINQPVAMIPLFWLVRSAKLEKRLDWQAKAVAERKVFAGRVEQHLKTNLERNAKHADDVRSSVNASIDANRALWGTGFFGE